jgi:hypothetical protein
MRGDWITPRSAVRAGEVSRKNFGRTGNFLGAGGWHSRGAARTNAVSLLHSLAVASSLLCSAPPMSAQSTVELRVTSVDNGEAKLLEQLLMQQIGDRLLEDGYRVVPAGEAASVRVWIHLGVDEATIETRGVGHQVERIADGDPQVMVLELQQLTTALVDEVRPSDAQPRMAVMIDVMGEAGDPQLRERLQTGLLARGFALTRSPNEEDLRLCVAADADGVFVHAVAGREGCGANAAATRVGEGASVEIERALLLDEASASLERVMASRASFEPSVTIEQASDEELPPVDTGPSTVPEREYVVVSKPMSVTVDASGGVFGRAGGADPSVGVELRGGRRYGIGGGVGVAVVPSRAEALRVIEYVPTAIFDWRLRFAGRGLAILGVFAGAHVHSYTYENSSDERGSRVGPSVGASVRLGFLGSRGALLFGGLRAGWSGGRWIHLADGEPSWRRAGLVVGVELGAGWDFILRGGR